MAETETKTGFRLPWTAERTESDVPSKDQASEPDGTAVLAVVRPMEMPPMTEMIDTILTPEQVIPDAAAVPGVRRRNSLMAELSRAMQAAAETARIETSVRFEAEAKTVVEEIHAASATAAASLRRQADDDVASVREWSKAEIARIREETEGRITMRKTALDEEMETHAGVVQARIERVTATVAEYEAQMTSFIERLLAEEDPTRIATMAETMPESPSLTDVAASVEDAAFSAFSPTLAVIPDRSARIEVPAATSEAASSEAPVATTKEIDPRIAAALAFEAAEAEAAAFTGDLDDDDSSQSALGGDHEADLEVGPAAASAPVPAPAPAESPLTTTRPTARVVVVGLVSVASIATFKRALGRVAGVSAIGVASGPDGEFVFSVSHDAGLDLAKAITGLAGFETRITAETADGLEVAAHDSDVAG